MSTNNQVEHNMLEQICNREDLAYFWSTQHPTRLPIVEFYGHNYDKLGLIACLSNFYRIEEALPFTVPDCCWERFSQIQGSDIDKFERTSFVHYSEQSIMLCKAAVMGDGEIYNLIKRAETPRDAKKLGRIVKPFDEDVWQSVILEVAFESVYQKFQRLKILADGDASMLREYNFLMKTGDSLVVEAASNDFIWGVGRPIGHKDCQNPTTWRRGNILGFAIMKARQRLRNESDQESKS